MPRNAHLHIVVSTEFLNQLKQEARKKMLTLAEFCRLRLQKSLQLDRMEFMLGKLIKKDR